jgi:hypothetical protein
MYRDSFQNTRERLKRQLLELDMKERSQNRESVRGLFSYHKLDEESEKRCYVLSDLGESAALGIMNVCPPCRDRTDAIRKLREAIHMAKASIALNGRGL